MTYLAPCPTSDCQAQPRDLTWYLLERAGKLPSNNSAWYQDNYDMLRSNRTHNVTLPLDLPNGGYLLRHEVRHIVGIISSVLN